MFSLDFVTCDMERSLTKTNKFILNQILSQLIYTECIFPSLSIGPVHFRCNGCWMVFSSLFNFWYSILKANSLKVKRTALIRKRYNQAPPLSQDTRLESNKNTINITKKSQEVSPFPAGEHNAAMNRREGMRNIRHKNTNDPRKKYHL